MEWISVKDRFPNEYDRWYLVLKQSECERCDNNDMSCNHIHRLNFQRFHYDIALWSQKDELLISYYQSKGDHSWDHCAQDRFTNSYLPHDEVTHWMPFPNQPERSKREDSQQCEMRCSEHCGNTVRDK